MNMKPCCQVAYRRALEEMLFVLERNVDATRDNMIEALKYGIDMLKEKEKKNNGRGTDC